jgi:hypothetical protein
VCKSYVKVYTSNMGVFWIGVGWNKFSLARTGALLIGLLFFRVVPGGEFRNSLVNTNNLVVFVGER